MFNQIIDYLNTLHSHDPKKHVNLVFGKIVSLTPSTHVIHVYDESIVDVTFEATKKRFEQRFKTIPQQFMDCKRYVCREYSYNNWRCTINDTGESNTVFVNGFDDILLFTNTVQTNYDVRLDVSTMCDPMSMCYFPSRLPNVLHYDRILEHHVSSFKLGSESDVNRINTCEVKFIEEYDITREEDAICSRSTSKPVCRIQMEIASMSNVVVNHVLRWILDEPQVEYRQVQQLSAR